MKGKTRSKQHTADLGTVDMINEYFAEIATDPTCNPVAVASYIHQLDESSTFEEFSEFQIWKMLDKQKKTAAGPDKIPYCFLTNVFF